MGSMISLGIGRMEIDWGKNSYFRDHSVLFKTTDVKQIPYYYVDEEGNTIIKMQEGYSCKLSQVKNRLNLLGYDYSSIQTMFNNCKEEVPSYMSSIDNLSFGDYSSVISNIDLTIADTTKFEKEFADNGYDFGEYVSKCIFLVPSIKEKLMTAICPETQAIKSFSIESDLSEFLENLDPYIPLRIICENPAYADYEQNWCYYDIVSGGYVDKNEIVKELDAEKRILIVTEGSSDSYILNRVIQELFPDISDFFVFIDMKENYPFTGTGNLFNFCKGLSKINIQNKVIVIFDNDTEGLEKYNKASLLDKPKSFQITKLPDMICFESFKTIGPQGISTENINGKAVAIECFLDFESVECQPIVRWSSYNDRVEQYQGALEQKEDYVKAFKDANLKDGSYNTKKLEYLIQYICDNWIGA